MNFTEQRSLQFKKLLKALKLSQKALISYLNGQGYQLDTTVLSSALNQRRPLPEIYTNSIAKALTAKIATQPVLEQTKLQSWLDSVFTQQTEDGRDASEVSAQSSTAPFVAVPPGEPLPNNCKHYIKRRCDTELQEQLQQMRPLLLISAPPKVGVTSLLNRTEGWLNQHKPRCKVIRVDLLQSWVQFEAAFTEAPDQPGNLNYLYAVFVYGLAKKLDKIATVHSKLAYLLTLNRPEQQIMLSREVTQPIALLLNPFPDICIMIDNHDKLLHQGYINLAVHTELLWFFKNSLAEINPQNNKYWRVICTPSPFVWFQDHHVSQALRQAATCEIKSFDHYEVQTLYHCLSEDSSESHASTPKQNPLIEFSTSVPDTSTIQKYTEQLGGVPFLLHYLLTQTQCANLSEAFEHLRSEITTPASHAPSALQRYKVQLQQLASIFEQYHTDLKQTNQTDRNPMQINHLLEKLGLLNPNLDPDSPSGQFTLNFDICIGS